MITISSNTLSTSVQPTVLDLQRRLSVAQKEATTHKLADPGNALGFESQRPLLLQGHRAWLTSIKSSDAVINTKLDTSQIALKSLASEAQELITSLFSAQSSGDTQILARKAAGILSSVIGSLNTNVDGTFVFGGQNSGVQPIADYPGQPSGTAKLAVDSAFTAEFGFPESDPRANAITASGIGSFLNGRFDALFTNTAWDGAWSKASDTATSSRIADNEVVKTSVSANEPAFRQLVKALVIASDLNQPNLNADAARALISKATDLAGSSVKGIGDLQSQLGITQSRIAEKQDEAAARSELLDKQLSEIEAVDPYEAATRVSQLTTQLETAYSLTARLSKLSLLNYL